MSGKGEGGRIRARRNAPRRTTSDFQHPQAIVESSQIGPGTRIGAFAHVFPDAVIGADCDICDHAVVESGARIGDRVTLECGVQIWNGVVLEDDVGIGPNATLINDILPRSRKRPPRLSQTVVRARASIGANATILPGLTIGRSATVSAGAVVTQDVPANAIVEGNPAYIKGYVASRQTRQPAVAATGILQLWPERVRGVKLHEVRLVTDLRGSLAVAEVPNELPFQPKRFFILFDVPGREVRGEHAHKALHQFLVCVKGDCAIVVDDGQNREEIVLNTPGIGVHLPPMVWGVQYNFSRDAVLLVLASEPYDPHDYIRDYDEFLACLAEQRGENAGCRVSARVIAKGSR